MKVGDKSGRKKEIKSLKRHKVQFDITKNGVPVVLVDGVALCTLGGFKLENDGKNSGFENRLTLTITNFDIV